MAKSIMEQLEQVVSTLIEEFRRLKDENEKLTGQVEDFKRASELLEKEKEFIKEKLKRLSELENENRNNEIDRQQIRQKVIDLLNRLEKFELT
tara:strand:- start:428 stop:706 length:279 start_codon:yes stop_codon:yes gene_type:complete